MDQYIVRTTRGTRKPVNRVGNKNHNVFLFFKSQKSGINYETLKSNLKSDDLYSCDRSGKSRKSKTSGPSQNFHTTQQLRPLCGRSRDLNYDNPGHPDSCDSRRQQPLYFKFTLRPLPLSRQLTFIFTRGVALARASPYNMFLFCKNPAFASSRASNTQNQIYDSPKSVQATMVTNTPRPTATTALGNIL